MKLGGAILLCCGPCILYNRYMTLSDSNFDGDPIKWILLLAGLLYLPMALIFIARVSFASAFNPINVIRSIFRVPGEYAVACVLVLLITFANTIVQLMIVDIKALWYLISTLRWTVVLYSIMVEMYILGLLYATCKNKLHWFDET